MSLTLSVLSALGFSSTPASTSALYAGAPGWCRTPEGSAGTFVFYEDYDPEACMTACSEDSACTGYEVLAQGKWTTGEAAYLDSFADTRTNWSTYHCELHSAPLAYAQTGFKVGVWEIQSSYMCYTKVGGVNWGGTDDDLPPTYSFFTSASGEVYGKALGGCRVADGTGGVSNQTYFLYTLTPKECQEKCDSDPACVGFEIDSYTDEERQIVLDNHPSGDIIVDYTCEIHTERLYYAQSSAIMAGGYDFGPNHVCFAQADPSARRITESD